MYIGCRAWGLGFGVVGCLALRIWGVGSRVLGLGLQLQGVYGSRSRDKTSMESHTALFTESVAHCLAVRVGWGGFETSTLSSKP